jgi:hypothetical protein
MKQMWKDLGKQQYFLATFKDVVMMNTEQFIFLSKHRIIRYFQRIWNAAGGEQ